MWEKQMESKVAKSKQTTRTTAAGWVTSVIM